MKLIVGLGNPGSQYDKTRHNAGFYVLDLLAAKLKVNFSESKKHNGEIAQYRDGDETYILLKPSTYMNLSGEAVLSVVQYYRIKTEDIIVVHDDLDLPVGKLRIRASGSSGGQKGMQNIIDLLKNQCIKRIRVGISNNKQIKDYVLTKIKSDEWPAYEESAKRAADAIAYSFDHKFELVMNKFNG